VRLLRRATTRPDDVRSRERSTLPIDEPAEFLVSKPVPVLNQAVPDPLATRAVDVALLRKEFRRKAPRGATGPRRRKVEALAGVTFTIARGETVAILGQNGSGKSTLVRVLSTLLLPDGGRATVFGHDVRRDARAVRRLVNRVSVEASFFKKMSAVENLSYAARFYGMSPRRTRERIPQILAGVSFPVSRRGEPMENLSRGMQQKVALARALLTAPVLLLLDEPTTGLDPRSKLEVQEFIRVIRGTHDATILLCTHDLAEAEALADRVGIIDRGLLLQLEPPAQLKAGYGVESLEQAFFAATGRALADDTEDGNDRDDDERDVFA
jgi:ABC-2 type transport system ATP-binding protein